MSILSPHKCLSKVELNRVWGIGLPILFFTLAVWVMPIATVFEFDSDEGIELVKATLYNQGYVLYDQIWNDQPPLFTLGLAAWFKLLSPSIEVARLLTLGFATVLVGAFFNSLNLVLGLKAALVGTVGLCLSMNFLRLSVSVMRGVPAIALALLAIYLLLWATQTSEEQGKPTTLKHYGGILTSGICFGLSLQFKFYTILFLPACILHLALGHCWQDWSKMPRTRQFYDSFLWLLACSSTALLVGLITESFRWDQLFQSHFDAVAQSTLQATPSWQVLLIFLAQDLDCSMLAVVGIWTLLKYRPRWPILPLVWLLSVLVGLAFHKPLWYHYYPLISVPILWLATYGVTQSFRSFRSLKQEGEGQPSWHLWQRSISWLKGQKLVGRLMLFAITLVPLKLAVIGVQNHLFVQGSAPKAALVKQVSAVRPPTQWIFTDLPMVAFYANLNVPPELVVFSTKRIESGNLSPTKMLEVLQTYRPGQVVLSRGRDQEATLATYLRQHYVLNHKKEDKITQYVLRSVPQSFSPHPSAAQF